MRQSHSIYTKIIFSLIAICIVVLGLIVFVILPLLTKIDDMQGQIQKNKQELTKITMEIDGFRGLAKELSEAFLERQALGQMFPLREDMAGLVESLESAAQNAGLEMSLKITDNLELAEASKGEGKPKLVALVVSGLEDIEEVPYTLELSGDYRQYIDFLLNLEGQDFISKITKLTFTADSIQNEKTKILENTGTARGDIEGVLFIRKLVK